MDNEIREAEAFADCQQQAVDHIKLWHGDVDEVEVASLTDTIFDVWREQEQTIVAVRRVVDAALYSEELLRLDIDAFKVVVGRVLTQRERIARAVMKRAADELERALVSIGEQP